MELIGRLLRMATNGQDRSFNRFARQYDLTGNQMSVIDYLAHRPANTCSQQMVEREFNVKRSTTTLIVQRLAKRGLIEQQPSAQDRRQKVIALTPKGKQLAPTIRKYITQQEKQLRAAFTPAELQHFTTILHYLIARGGQENSDKQ